MALRATLIAVTLLVTPSPTDASFRHQPPFGPGQPQKNLLYMMQTCCTLNSLSNLAMNANENGLGKAVGQLWKPQPVSMLALGSMGGLAYNMQENPDLQALGFRAAHITPEPSALAAPLEETQKMGEGEHQHESSPNAEKSAPLEVASHQRHSMGQPSSEQQHREWARQFGVPVDNLVVFHPALRLASSASAISETNAVLLVAIAGGAVGAVIVSLLTLRRRTAPVLVSAAPLLV